MLNSKHITFLICLLMLTPSASHAEEALIAVASNFAPVMKPLISLFEKQTDHHIQISIGSTGRHYAQIIHGAPFDAFFASDTQRPLNLEDKGYIVSNTRFTYALGTLVLWSPAENFLDPAEQTLDKQFFNHIAIANPKLAPYGAAALQVLQSLHIHHALKDKIVMGENVGQAYQFISTGNAELGFVSYSQIIHQTAGSIWIVPKKLYSPIQQQAALLRPNIAAQDFLEFMKTSKAIDIIKKYGYGAPS